MVWLSGGILARSGRNQRNRNQSVWFCHRRWQLDHDGPPPDIATMVKAAGMSEVPTDPYSDRPMLMTTINGRPVIYSVALDGKDDRGLVEWNLRVENPTGDLLFRLPVPQ